MWVVFRGKELCVGGLFVVVAYVSELLLLIIH